MNAVDTMSATVYFWCLLAFSLVADPKLHENENDRQSRRMTFQVFAVHQAVHIAILVSALSHTLRENLYVTYHSPTRLKRFAPIDRLGKYGVLPPIKTVKR